MQKEFSEEVPRVKTAKYIKFTVIKKKKKKGGEGSGESRTGGPESGNHHIEPYEIANMPPFLTDKNGNFVLFNRILTEPLRPSHGRQEPQCPKLDASRRVCLL